MNLKNRKSKISYDKDVEKIQIALQFLGYSLPKWGVDGLKSDIGSDKLSKCESLKTWGTGDLVAKVLSKDEVTPPKIYA